MMRILRKGERYVLNKPNEKSYFLSSYIRQGIMLLIGLFYFQFVCLAQSSRLGGTTGIGEIKPLMVGQKVSEEILNYPFTSYNIFTNDSSVSTLTDYKDKLVILDFWGSWCSSCLLAFPKINKLSKEFEKSVRFLFVHIKEDDFSNAVKVLKNNREYPSEFIISNNVFNEVFEYSFLPHYVWISGNGVVLAVTGTDMLTKDNISNLLSKFQAN